MNVVRRNHTNRVNSLEIAQLAEILERVLVEIGFGQGTSVFLELLVVGDEELSGGSKLEQEFRIVHFRLYPRQHLVNLLRECFCYGWT